MNEITTMGLDLAKNVFHVVGCNARGKEVKRKMLRRGQMMAYFANVPACVVGMEACASAHHWGRRLQELGHEVRLIPPQHVKAYLRGNKNDYNDARAIAEAAQRPDMRFVGVKTVEQQDVQALHRLREARVGERTALCNQVRGLLSENGIVMAQGLGKLRRRLPEVMEDAENGLSDLFREFLAQSYRQLCELDEHIGFYDAKLREHARANEAVKRLQTVPGYGPVVASVFEAFVGDGRAYRRGARCVGGGGAGAQAALQRGQDGAVGHQQARGPVLALPAGAWSAFGAQASAGQGRPIEPLGAGGAGRAWDAQGDRGVGEQDGAHRLGGAESAHCVPGGVSGGVEAGESCADVDESFGPARALRAVWTARGQRWRVAHRLPTLSRLSPTSAQDLPLER